MERSLIDTDMFSEVLRRRNAVVCQNAEEYLIEHKRFTLSAITVTEVVDGFRRRSLQSHIDRLLSRLESEGHAILPIEFAAARLAGLILGDLHRTGQPVGRADPLIAAIAIEHDLALVTGNTQHFERIQALGYSLRLRNWRES